MKTIFTIKFLEFKTIRELPDAWTLNDYKLILDAMEYGDISDIDDNELKDMCLMYLSENEPEESANIILNYLFKDQLNSGQIHNLSHEMLDEKMWEEYADISMHETFFNVHQLLYEAYNGKFPRPEAVLFQLEITSKNADTLNVFNKDGEATLLRLLAQGMPANTVINRLYDEQLDTGKFEEAKDIIWQVSKQTKGTSSILFTLVSSLYWFKDLKYIEEFEAVLNRLDIDFHKN